MLSSTLKTKTLNYQNNRTSAMSTSRFSLPLLISITFLSALLLSFFASSFFLSPKSSHADSSTIDISLTIEPATILAVGSTCSIPMSITDPFGYCDVTANVQSNVDIGYSLYLSMPEETITTNDNTCIRHSSTIPPATTNPTACSTLNNSHKFNPITTPTDENGTFITLPSDYTTNSASLTTFAKGTYGLAYDSTTSYTKFTGIPSYSGAPLLIKQTSTPTASDNTTLRFAAHYNLTDNTTTNQVTGNYQGTVLVTALSNAPILSAENATMQNFDSNLCAQMTNYDTADGEQLANSSTDLRIVSLAGKNTAYLKDSRNNQLYRIRKMQDGRCWMIDNLKIASGTVLTNSDTDMSADSYTISELMDPTSSSASDAGAYCSSTVFADFPNTTTGCGYLYNWGVATAGTGTPMSYGTGASICPKNWDLPTQSQFTALNTSISLIAGGGQSWQGAYSGTWEGYSNGPFAGQGSVGLYYTSTGVGDIGWGEKVVGGVAWGFNSDTSPAGFSVTGISWDFLLRSTHAVRCTI